MLYTCCRGRPRIARVQRVPSGIDHWGMVALVVDTVLFQPPQPQPPLLGGVGVGVADVAGGVWTPMAFFMLSNLFLISSISCLAIASAVFALTSSSRSASLSTGAWFSVARTVCV